MHQANLLVICAGLDMELFERFGDNVNLTSNAYSHIWGKLILLFSDQEKARQRLHKVSNSPLIQERFIIICYFLELGLRSIFAHHLCQI